MNELLQTGLKSLIQQAGIGVWSWLEGKVDWDEQCSRVFGVTDGPANYEEYLALIVVEDRQMVHDNVQRSMATGVYAGMEHRLRRPDGEVRWVLARGTVIKDQQGKTVGLMGTVFDITERKEQELLLQRRSLEDQQLCQTLSALALKDALTGAHNRRWFEGALAHELERARRYQRTLSLAMIDVNDFKRLNDELGHDAADEVLKRLVEVIEAVIRASDRLSRWGGDEFAVIMPETAESPARELMIRLAASVSGELHAAGAPVTLSFGVASMEPEDDWRKLVHRADQQLLAAKRDLPRVP